MIRRAASYILIVFLLQAFLPGQSALPVQGEQGQTVEQMKKVVQKAIQKNKDIKVVLKDKHKYVGPVSEASDEGFVMTDSKSARHVQLAFVDVKQVSPKGLSTAAKAAIIGGGVTAGVLAIVWASLASKD